MQPALDVIKNSVIYHVVTGSTSYGLTINTSDRDEKAVVLLPLSYHLSLDKEWETQVGHHPDIEYHSLKKFMNLAASQNPTILEMLYTEAEFVLFTSPLFNRIRDNRQIFLSQNCFYSFGGYARNQLVRLKGGLDKAMLIDISAPPPSVGKLEKHAMHLVRLLTMGCEILETGAMQVHRTQDRPLLLSIRNGEKSWEDIFELAYSLEKRLEAALAHTALPQHVEREKIQELYSEIILRHAKDTFAE
ncbi:nucleotidyltransferase domain-containing protein [Aneurinibacillus tyrosinisolvens]|uniref:nucleotidyltransferase domain-containing protein n=1 Tax=Aneurinibacillus tyrosinisolvens TaxID=1443435 RepID=UPI00063F7A96|nr:nucleotidyltransferase domain-containing protein [Aneurinibacillus tyrosinisolvens]